MLRRMKQPLLIVKMSMLSSNLLQTMHTTLFANKQLSIYIIFCVFVTLQLLGYDQNVNSLVSTSVMLLWLVTACSLIVSCGFLLAVLVYVHLCEHAMMAVV